jgi:hypothetical protein
MRTTVDLPPAVHRRAHEIAKAQGRSLSSVVSELTVRGLAQLGDSVTIGVDELSGFPVVSVGRSVSPDDVAAALDDE